MQFLNRKFRYHTDKVNIGWQIWKFDRTLADLEPEQGVPRYITTEYEHKSSRMLRRGLAFQLEHGFWSTEEGKLNYAMNIQTIRSAVHETVYQSILHSLLNEGQALTKVKSSIVLCTVTDCFCSFITRVIMWRISVSRPLWNLKRYTSTLAFTCVALSRLLLVAVRYCQQAAAWSRAH